MPHTPLAGLRVLLTRPQSEGADDWAAAFMAAGAEPIAYPTIAVAPPESWQPLDLALAGLDGYDWIIFTSQTAVAVVLSRLPGRRFAAAMRAKIAAVGPSTGRAVDAGGGKVALVPRDRRQEGLVEALRSVPAGARILLPIAAGGRTLLAESLRGRGCTVDVLPIYATVPRADLPPPPAFDVATFASPSALRAYLAHAGAHSLAGKMVGVIGATTAKEAAANGLVPVVAENPDVESLILAIVPARSSQGDP
jgi:uroporphyrinogen III methyltransferase / synthase